MAAPSSHRARLRAWSNSVFGRDPSPGEEKAANTLHKLASAGLDLTISPTDARAQQVQNAASTVLQELDRVASLADRPEQPGHLTRRLTIQVVDDAQSEHGVHPITEVDENPFDTQSERAESFYDFEEDIYIVKHEEGKLFTRALIDTGMDGNAISSEKAQKTGIPTQTWTGGKLRDADGEPFEPEGVLKAQFHFDRQYQSTRTWEVEFMILHDPPFDVAIGRQFINSARLFKKSEVLLPIVVQKPKDKAAQDAKTAEARRNSDLRKIQEQEQRRKIREREHEKKKAGKT